VTLLARLHLALCFALALGILAAAERAEAQNAPGAVVGVNPANNQLVIDPINGLPNDLVIGLNPDPPFTFVFDPLYPLLPGQGCQHLNPGFRNLAGCLPIPPSPSLTGMDLALQALASNNLKILPTVPALPGPNTIQGGQKRDVIQGGQSGEQINTGKGKDDVNAGPGNDDVNTGPGNDKIDTKDGEKDKVNGGKGNDDKATVDKKDDVRNVEDVKRK
jgi:Ca2+-binding RTX toxin-like protein